MQSYNQEKKRGKMKLKDYLETNGMTKEQFAQKIGCSLRTVYSWLGGVLPTWLYKRHIQEVTNGKVKENDWETENETKTETNKLLRGGRSDGMRGKKRVGVDKKTKLKSSKKK